MPDKVIWGRYCGECIGNCSTMREITNTKLSIDKSDKFLKSDPHKFNYEFMGIPEPASEHKKYKWLLQKPIPNILSKGTMVFGQPDAYDQCGYYFMYSFGALEHKALIDTQNVPEEFEQIVKKLFHETL